MITVGNIYIIRNQNCAIEKNYFLWDCGNCVGSHKDRTIIRPVVFNKAHQEKDAGKVSALVKSNADAFVFLLFLYISLRLVYFL